MRKLALASIVLTSCALVGADKAVTVGDITVKVAGQSGKMTLTVPTGNGAETQAIDVKMEALRQLDSSGKVLGGGGATKRSFNSFATQNFVIADATSAKYNGINVTKISFEAILGASSKLKVDTMVFGDKGDFQVGSDVIKVVKGTVKFNVVLSGWEWCGVAGVTCAGSDGVGHSLELDISVRGKSDPAKKAGEVFDLGDNTALSMLKTYSTKAEVWTLMPEGYPKVNGATFTLKFPKEGWDDTLTYDPIITGADSTSGAAAVASHFSVLWAFVAAWFAM